MAKLSSTDIYGDLYVDGTINGNAATATKVNSKLIIKLNGGTTENTNLFTFDGSGAKTINITPSSIGAAASSHGTHVTWATTAPKANGTAAVGTVDRVAREDHVHPAQVNITGNAATATKLLKNIVLRLNSGTTEGTDKFSYDGSTSYNIDITASKVGAAPASHTHNYAGSGSAGGAANSVKSSLLIKLNNGGTEGTNQFTFNGSTAQTINITPSSIGAAASSHGTHVSYGGNGSATTVSRSDHTHSYLPLSGGTLTGNVKFADVTSTTYPAVSNKISWNGSTDGADIYYQVDAADKGRLVLNTRDDTDCVIAFANKDIIKSTVDANGNFSGTAANSSKVNGYSFWVGTQTDYDAISSKSSTTVYLIKE